MDQRNSLPTSLAATESREPKWYVLFVRSNQEKRITSHLTGRGIKHFLPCYESLRQWKDRRVVLMLPLFPGYVFVHLALTERLKVLTIPNVVSLVGNKHSAAMVADEEIAWIESGIRLGAARPHPPVVIGERVRIMRGVMNGLEGILVRQQNSTRVVVSIDCIASAFSINVDIECVHPLSGDRFSTSRVLHEPVIAGKRQFI